MSILKLKIKHVNKQVKE